MANLYHAFSLRLRSFGGLPGFVQPVVPGFELNEQVLFIDREFVLDRSPLFSIFRKHENIDSLLISRRGSYLCLTVGNYYLPPCLERWF